MFIEVEHELRRLTDAKAEGAKIVEARKRYEIARTASYHRPHGCMVLPCAVCRGDRPKGGDR